MTHCQQPHLFALYAFGTWHIVSSVASFFWGLNTLSLVFFPFFEAWKFLSSFFSSLTYGNFSAVFFFLFAVFAMFFLYGVKYLKGLKCSVFNAFYTRIEVDIYSKSSDSYLDTWGIHFCPVCSCIFHHLY